MNKTFIMGRPLSPPVRRVGHGHAWPGVPAQFCGPRQEDNWEGKNELEIFAKCRKGSLLFIQHLKSLSLS